MSLLRDAVDGGQFYSDIATIVLVSCLMVSHFERDRAAVLPGRVLRSKRRYNRGLVFVRVILRVTMSHNEYVMI